MKDKKPKAAQTLRKTDYYFNKKGLMVLTESYLLERGFCCESGCLHCPYGFKNKKNKKL